MRRLSLLTAFLLLAAPAARAADPKKADKVTYDDHVLPLLRDKCVACHGQDKKNGGLQVHNYTALMQGGSSGAVVKPGDPENSALYLAVAHKKEPFMPPRSPALPKEAADLVQRWIAGGALENAGSKAILAAKPTVDVSLKTVARGKPEGPPPMPPATLAQDPVVRTGRANAVTALAASPWAPLVAVGGQKQVLLYNSDTLDLLGVLPFPEGEPHVLKFSRNGSLLLAGGGRGGKSGKVVLWSVTTGERVIALGDESDCVLAADVSPDQSMVALGGPSKMIRIYSTRDGKPVHEIKKHTDWVTSLEFSPDGVLLATGDRNGGLFVWEAFTAREYFSLRGHTAAITDVAWRPDGNVLASASEDTTVRLWEMENGSQIKGWGAHAAGTESVKYGKEGRLVTCGRDRLVRLWDGNGGQQRAFEALPDVALRCAFTHDGGRVVAGDWTGQLSAWSAVDGKLAGKLTANPPGLAERLELAVKDLAARQAARDQAAAAAAASQAALQKATADLAAAQKAVADGPALVKAAQDKAAATKAAADKAKAALAAAQSDLRAKQVLAQAQAEAAAKVKAQADAAKDDKAALAAAAGRAQGLASQFAAEVTAAQRLVNDGANTARATEAEAAGAQQAALAAADAAARAPKGVEAQAGAVKAATAKAAADKAAADAAASAYSATAASVERMKAAQGRARK
jgi:hypothetical protein